MGVEEIQLEQAKTGWIFKYGGSFILLVIFFIVFAFLYGICAEGGDADQPAASTNARDDLIDVFDEELVINTVQKAWLYHPKVGQNIPLGVAVSYYVASNNWKYLGWGSYFKVHKAYGKGALVSAGWIDYKEITHYAKWLLTEKGDIYAINEEAKEFGSVSKHGPE